MLLYRELMTRIMYIIGPFNNKRYAQLSLVRPWLDDTQINGSPSIKCIVTIFAHFSYFLLPLINFKLKKG